MRYAVYERSRCCSYYNSLRRRNWLPAFETDDIDEAVRDCLYGIEIDLPEFILDREKSVIIDLEFEKAFPLTSCLPCLGGNEYMPIGYVPDKQQESASSHGSASDSKRRNRDIR